MGCNHLKEPCPLSFPSFLIPARTSTVFIQDHHLLFDRLTHKSKINPANMVLLPIHFLAVSSGRTTWRATFLDSHTIMVFYAVLLAILIDNIQSFGLNLPGPSSYICQTAM